MKHNQPQLEDTAPFLSYVDKAKRSKRGGQVRLHLGGKVYAFKSGQEVKAFVLQLLVLGDRAY
jgi:hypothetical protein